MHRRLVVVSLFTFALFSLLIVQYYRIQIIEGKKWQMRALKQHQHVVCQPFRRGLFYSNTSLLSQHPEKDQPFVIDVTKFHLYADPEAIACEKKEEIVRSLASLLKLQGPHQDKLRKQLYKKSRSRKLVLWMEGDIKARVESWWILYSKKNKIARNALFFVQDYKRSYPFGRLLGQVLHTVREERDEKSAQSIPTGGLELTFDKYLQGKAGRRVVLRSPRHPLDAGPVLEQPVDGADVYLTINHYLQAVAEEEIAKAVQTAGAKGGWAILMEPHSGEVYALAQYPFFDPSNYRSYFNNPALLEDTKLKAITDPYEPGSSMKPITLAIALKANQELIRRKEAPLFTPQEKIATTTSVFPGRNKPLKDTHPHNFLNMYLALQKSSNVYMAKLVQRIIQRLGSSWYRSALHDFGFGMKSGIELPSESPGLLPRPGKNHPSGAAEWSSATPYSLAMGHNILVNSLQMVSAYAMIANGGYAINPTLVRKIVKQSGEIVLDHTKRERGACHLDPEILRQLHFCMKLVTKPGGTAPRADIPGYSEAGKTGTSEKIVNGIYSKKNHISTFVGFAPVINPRFVLLIAIDEPAYTYIPGVGKNQSAGTCAAPAFSAIGLKALQYLGVEPDDPYGYPKGDPRHNEEKADMMKQVKELKQLYAHWNQ